MWALHGWFNNCGFFLHRRNSERKITTSALSESMTCSLCIVLHVCMHSYNIYNIYVHVGIAQ